MVSGMELFAPIPQSASAFKYLGVFGACSRCTQTEVSERGISVGGLLAISCGQQFVIFQCFVDSTQDLCNQIKHWEGYSQALQKIGKTPGQFLSPGAAEWFSGEQF